MAFQSKRDHWIGGGGGVKRVEAVGFVTCKASAGQTEGSPEQAVISLERRVTCGLEKEKRKGIRAGGTRSSKL